MVDIRDAEAVAAMFAEIKAAHGGVNLLVNSAGGQFPQAAIDFSVKGWNAVVNTNLNGTWFMMQAAARLWRDAGVGGAIVNIVVVTRHGLYGVAHTVAARAGVIAFPKASRWNGRRSASASIASRPARSRREGWKVYTPGSAQPLIREAIR